MFPVYWTWQHRNWARAPRTLCGSRALPLDCLFPETWIIVLLLPGAGPDLLSHSLIPLASTCNPCLQSGGLTKSRLVHTKPWPKEEVCYLKRYLHHTSITALFTVAKTRKQPKCPSTGEWIKKMCYINKRGISFSHFKKRKSCLLQEHGWTSGALC